VYGCSNVADRERGLSLHRIPFWNDERPEAKERKEKWIDFVRKHRAEWIPSRQSVICSRHFLAEHFDRMFLSLPGFSKQFIPRLKRDEIGINAIPMIDPPLPDSIKIVDTVQTDSGVESGGPKRYVSRQRKKCKHTYICDNHKNVIQKARNKRKRSPHSEDENDSVDMVDFSSLQISTLRRYRKHFKLQNKAGMNKSQLLETISRHFRSIPVPEKETITYFIYMVKTHKSKLDQRPSESS